MPELPEVETVKKSLQQLIIGKTIQDIIVTWPKIVKVPDDVVAFRQRLLGQTVEGIERRGKFLMFNYTDDVLVSHLRMEGKYRLAQQDDPVDKHTHVRFLFTDQSELRYHDVRKFGTMHVFAKGTEGEQAPLATLGPEPLSDAFTVPYLQKACHRTTRVIKAALLDQTVVVGLGNIYVDEALFAAGLHPECVAADLREQDIVRLHQAIYATLTHAVTEGGTTIRSYENSHGEMGRFQQSLHVYSRVDEPCHVCGTMIAKKWQPEEGPIFVRIVKC